MFRVKKPRSPDMKLFLIACVNLALVCLVCCHGSTEKKTSADNAKHVSVFGAIADAPTLSIGLLASWASQITAMQTDCDSATKETRSLSKYSAGGKIKDAWASQTTTLQKDCDSTTKETRSLSKYSAGGNECRFLLLGKTGSGKSTTGNTILGAKLFSVGTSFGSVTNECELRRNTNLGRKMEIMDTPGLFDTNRTHIEISIDIVKSVAAMHPGPHAVLYIIAVGRFTEEEFKTYERLKALFDQDLLRYMVVVFTGGHRLGPDETIEQMLENAPENLRKVLEECGQRYVLFNNFADNTTPYVQRLLSVVDTMNHHNNGEPYSCPKYSEVGRMLDEEVKGRLALAEQLKFETPKVKQPKLQQEQDERAREKRQREQEEWQRWITEEREQEQREWQRRRERERKQEEKDWQRRREEEREEERMDRQRRREEEREEERMDRQRRREEERAEQERRERWREEEIERMTRELKDSVAHSSGWGAIWDFLLRIIRKISGY